MVGPDLNKICSRFKPGKLYKLTSDNRSAKLDVPKRKKLRYVRDEGIHHIFESPTGGWLESFTDFQLLDITIKPCD